MTELEKKGKAALVPSGWDYAPAPESREIVRIDERYGHFVGGEWLEPRETYTTIAPASEEPLAEVGQATPEEVHGAIATAREAFENGWSALPGLSGRSTCSGSRGSSRSAHASSPCSSR